MTPDYIGLDDQGPKPFWQSRTIIGAFVVIAAQILRFKGFHVDTDATTDDILTGMNLVGAALALVGRIKATRPIMFMRGTTPGGPFNPDAEVKKAAPANTVGTPVPPGKNGQSGRADLDALVIVIIIFLLAGIAFCGFQNNAPMASREVPEVIAHRQAADWMQVVRVEDTRPFFARLLASLKCTPTLAIVRGTNPGGAPYGVTLTEIEITGGADF